MFRWLQSKMRQNAAESASVPDDREFGPAPWSVRVDSGLDLCVTSGRDSGRSVPLDHAFAVLGRAKSLRTFRPGWIDIVDATVSRRQAVVEFDPLTRWFALHHVQGATNVTRVDGRAGARLDLKAGSTISIGIVTAEIRKRNEAAVLSTFVEDTLGRVASKARYDQFHNEDLALTVISEEGQGNTWILNRCVYPLSAPADGSLPDLVGLNTPHDEVGLLFWSDDAGYRILGNGAAPGIIRLYKGHEEAKRPDRMFAHPRAAALQVDDSQAHVLHPGDVIQFGNHRLRLHAYGRPLVEACLRHALSGKAPEELAGLDEMLSGVAPTASDGSEPDDAGSDFAPPTPRPAAAAQPARPFMPFGGSAPPAPGGGFGAGAAAPPVAASFHAPAPPAPGGGFGATAPPAPGGGFGAPAPPAPGGGFGAPAPPAPGGGFGAPAPPAPGGGFGAPAPPRPPSGFGAPAPAPEPAAEEADYQRPWTPNEQSNRVRAFRPRREGDEPLQAGPPPKPPSAGRTPRSGRQSFGGRDDGPDAETTS